MGKKVEVDYQVLEDAIQEMNDAKDEFHSCVENGFKTELENLDSMNSDFVDKLTRVLEYQRSGIWIRWRRIWNNILKMPIKSNKT